MTADAAAHAPHSEHHEKFIWRYVFSQDHKYIGKQYLITSFLMALIGGSLAMLIRLQLAYPGWEWPLLGKLMPNAFPMPEGAYGGVMNPDFYISLVTMHGTIMVFFFLTASLTGTFGNFLIPLQIGARDMAFPFLNMMSYWTFLLSCLILISSFFMPGGASASGWTAYPTLSALEGAVPGSGMGQTLLLIALAFFIMSGLMGSLNFITTILNMRAPGLTFSRLPLSLWSLFVTSILGLLAFPVLLGAAIMLLFDRHFGTSFFIPGGLILSSKAVPHEGGSVLMWQHLFWFLGHPEVYILMLPPMGIMSEVIATNCRKPIFGYKMMIASIIAIGGLSFVVWGHHMFMSGMQPGLGSFFMVMTAIIAVPSAIKTFNWLATLWRSQIRFNTPMLFALGFLSLFITGGLSGIFLANPPIDIHLHDTYFVVAHFHFIMAGSALFGVFAGTYHWFPKMFGRTMNETLGKLHFFLTFATYYGVFYVMHFTGFMGMTRRYFTHREFEFLKGSDAAHMFMTWSAFLLGAAQFLFAINFFWSIFKGRKSGRNPWKGTTLEWTADSPPPHGNFEEVPVVHRWPYEFAHPDAKEDFVMQTAPVMEVPTNVDEENVDEENDDGTT